MFVLKVRKIGNSSGVTIPKEALAQLRVEDGDTLLLTESPDGFIVTPYDQDFADSLDAFERTRRKYRNALRTLAE
jgi:putative addiction module antidote